MPAIAIKSAERSVEIADREFTVLAGPAGSGKSSLLRLIAGLEQPQNTEVFFGERRMDQVPAHERDVVLVARNHIPYPLLSVYKNLAFGLKRRKFSDAEIRKRVSAAAETMGLESLLEKKGRTLAPEQRQRLAIARALACQPKVVLFDEPLADMGREVRGRLRAEIARLSERLPAATMLYATADPLEAMAMGEALLLINRGAIQQAGPPRNIYQRPANLFVAGFLGVPAMNLISGSLKQERESLVFVEEGEGTIKLPLAAEAFLEGAAAVSGQSVVLGVRPEDLSISEQTGFPALLDRAELAGAETLFYLETGAHSLVCRTVNASPTGSGGTRVRFQIDPKKVHLFDPKSTRRIGLEA